jgi:sporulation protein YlmC with PRC-barrel domain/CBS domain-containing protein
MHQTQLSHLYLTELMGLVVYDLRGRRIGKIQDAAVLPLVDPARVDRFLVGGGWSWLSLRHDQVASISLDGIRLRDEVLMPYHADEYMLRLVRDLLDQQIIDSQGRKVVRVTDVTFQLRDGRELWVMEVDIGIRSVFRRLFQGVLPPKWIRKLQNRISVNSIPWEYSNILEPDPQRRLRLNINTTLLEKMHPADLADLVEELGPDDRGALFEAMDAEAAADTLTELEPEMQASILEHLETETAAHILEEMAPDEAAAALSEVEEHTSAEILEEMDAEPKTEVREFLEYEEGTAGRLMTTEFTSIPSGSTVGEAFAALANDETAEALNTVFVVDSEGKLEGAIPLGRLFGKPPETPLAQLELDKLIYAPVDMAEPEVMELFDKYNLLTLPVVDEEGVLQGVVMAHEVISLLRQER